MGHSTTVSIAPTMVVVNVTDLSWPQICGKNSPQGKPFDSNTSGGEAMMALIFIACVVGILVAGFYRYLLGKIDVSPQAQNMPPSQATPLMKQKLKQDEEQKKDENKENEIREAINFAKMLADNKSLDTASAGKLQEHLKNHFTKDEDGELAKMTVQDLMMVISEGANQFLFDEYKYMAVFMVVFGIIILVALGIARSQDGKPDFVAGLFSAVAFWLGALTSILSGFIGMRIAVFTNGRVTLAAKNEGLGKAFNVAFQGGLVMGFGLTCAGLLVLMISILLFSFYYNSSANPATAWRQLFESIAGYGLGGSSIALFGRVGGGIYTKAADVGADLCGKLKNGLNEDDPRNPATIADNVGDNVGDIAGMGSDLFGSFAESTCAALVIAANSPNQEFACDWKTMLFPLGISAAGVLVCFITKFVAIYSPPQSNDQIESCLKKQLIVSTVLMTGAAAGLTYTTLPQNGFAIIGGSAGGSTGRCGEANFLVPVKCVFPDGCFISILCGLWSGLFIGIITEYFTSHGFTNGWVQEMAHASDQGPSMVVTYGLALGYFSCILPAILLGITIYVSFALADAYGVALAALGILSTMSIGLTIDAYGPISDNAGGIAEMAQLDEYVRTHTDALDAAGNTTAAIGKGFAIGSAALVALALFSAYVVEAEVEAAKLSILQPGPFTGLLLGAMLPYAFFAMTLKSVGIAANEMMNYVSEKLPQILDASAEPDPEKLRDAMDVRYERCVSIATKASLSEMMPPGALVIFSPLVVGIFLGKYMLAGLLAGALVSGVQMAISSSNSGGAWDNAKKYIEKEGKKHTKEHEAAVIGDTVGDPLKDTSGPALNILIKLMAIISLVFAPFINKYGGETGLIGHAFGGKYNFCISRFFKSCR